MIDVLIYLVVLVIVVALVWWLLDQLPLPEPIGRIVRIVLIVVVVLIVIGVLLQFTGHGNLLRLR